MVGPAIELSDAVKAHKESTENGCTKYLVSHADGTGTRIVCRDYPACPVGEWEEEAFPQVDWAKLREQHRLAKGAKV